MEKRVILERLIENMMAELDATRRASEDAAAYATDEEAKARSQWDTQGLEASYLAAGQAGHAKALVASIQRLRSEFNDLVTPRKIVETGALFACTIGDETDWYLVAPEGGGEEVRTEAGTVTVMTPRSPLYASLKGKTRGETVHLPSGATLRVSALQ